MVGRRIISGAVGVALLLCGLSSQRVVASPTMSLPNCQGKPEVRPREVVFACADGNFSAEQLRWSGWGGPSPTAVGIAEVNDCTPNCAAGKMHRYRIHVTAGGRQTCPGGRPAYRSVTYAWIGHGPSMGSDSTYPYPCGPRM